MLFEIKAQFYLQVMYEDDEKTYESIKDNPILHSAMCVLSNGVEPHLLLITLPEHLQVGSQLPV